MIQTLQQIVVTLTAILFALQAGVSGLPANSNSAAVGTTKSSQPAGQVLGASTDGLVGYWKFDESSGSTAIDSSGNNNNGIVTSGVWTAGKIGNALNFNGTATNVKVSKINLVGGNYTFAFWANRVNNQYVVDASGSGGRLIVDFGLNSSKNNTLSFHDSAWHSTGDVSANTWHHVVLTLDSSTGMATMYLDGVSTATATYTTITNLTDLYIGSSYSSSAFYQGLLDEFRVYNRALSAAEVLDIYNDKGVVVPSAPNISSFIASPSSVTPGNSSNLSWSVSGATSINIDNGVGDVSSLTSKSVSPTQSTTYTLTATNSQDSDTANTTVTVTALPPTDTTLPSIPSNLSATAVSSSQINLSWTASTDNVAVTGYKIYRGGTQIGTSVTNNYSNTGLLPSTSYSYTVSAFDAAGNNSAQSSATSAITQAEPLTSSSHPKLLFDSADWTRMRSAAVANTTDWQAMKAQCDYYLDSKVRYPAGDGNTGTSVIVPGTTGTRYDGRLGDAADYQGGQYAIGAMTLAGCYQALLPSNPTAARVYSSKAREIILAITAPPIIMTKGSQTIFLTSRTLAGGVYYFYWDPVGANIAIGDTVTISGSLGCTNINGTWTVSAVNPANLAFAGQPTANADCLNYSWNYSKDNNYGFRNFGPALALLYDWLYDELSSGEKAALTTTMSNIVKQVIRNGYGSFKTVSNSHPENNYASSYMMAMGECYAAWKDDDATLANTCQSQWNGNMLGANMKRDYYNLWMSGGGDGEGNSAYGQGTITRVIENIMTMKVQGIDLVQPPYSFNYCEDQAKYFLMGSKPDRFSMGENEYVTFNYATKPSNPTFMTPEMLYKIDWCVARQGSTYAPYFHSLVDYAIANERLVPPPVGTDWDKVYRFLFYDSARASSDPTILPLSYRAWGGNMGIARSDWSPNAVSVEFQGGPTTGNSGNGKTQWMSGALAIWNGPYPFLVFGHGERARSYDILTSAQANDLQNERSAYNNRKNSIFAADRPGSNFSRIDGLPSATHVPSWFMDASASLPTKIDRGEDTGTYTYYRSVGLEATTARSLVDSQYHRQLWTRQVFYVRPKLVIVYDTTTVKYADDDRAMFWTFGRSISRVGSSPAGQSQFQATRNGGANFVGQLTTVLPASATTSIVNHCLMTMSGTTAVCSGGPLNFLYRVEVRPSAMDHTDDRWLTVLDAADSVSAEETITKLTATNLDAIQLSVSGVVGFVPTNNPILPISYNFNGSNVKHYISGLTPNTAYSVDTTTAGKITITSGSGYTASASGVLSFQTGVGDSVPPSVPTSLSATTVSSSAINLSWTASTDNVSVAGYKIYRGGTQIGTSVTNSYSDTGLTASTAYTYTVSAYDTSSNNSAQSTGASATTQSASSPSTKFTIGQRIKTTSNLNVRATASASGTLLGTQSLGALGTIINGGQSVGGYYWWNVNYDNAPDGYSVEDYLNTYSTAIVGDFNHDGLVNSIDLSLMTTAWNTNNATYDLNHDGIVNSLDYAIMVQNWSL